MSDSSIFHRFIHELQRSIASMPDNWILSYDVGTSGTKAVVTDLKQIISSAYRPYDVNYPRPGWAEQDPRIWWRAIKETTQEIIKKVEPNLISGISFSSQMGNVIFVDKNGNPLRNCISWLDSRAKPQADWILRTYGNNAIYSTSGIVVSEKEPNAKVLWVKENETSIFEKAYKIIDCKDYIEYRMTGKFVTDYSVASWLSFFDIKKRKWSEELCEMLGVPIDKFPEAHSSIEIVGELTSDASNDLGLKRGTPIIAGAGDGAMSSVGAGATKDGAGHICIGTAGWLSIISSKLTIDPKARFIYICSADPDKWNVVGETDAAGESYKWFKERFCEIEEMKARETGNSAYKIMDEEAQAVEEGSSNLIFLPYLTGERAPITNPRARAVFLGLSSAHTRSHLIRAVMEGVAFNIRWIIDSVEEIGYPVGSLRGVGGGVKSRVWGQIFADVLDRAIVPTRWSLNECAMGAAIVAAVGLGILKDLEQAEDIVPVSNAFYPDPTKRSKYDALFPIFKDAYANLTSTFDKLREV